MKPNFFQAATLKKICVEATLKKSQVAPYKNLSRLYRAPFKSLLRVQIKRANDCNLYSTLSVSDSAMVVTFENGESKRSIRYRTSGNGRKHVTCTTKRQTRHNNRSSNSTSISTGNFTSSHNLQSRKQEDRLSRISVGIVSLYIICHIWRIVPTAYEAIYSEEGFLLSKWPTWLIHIYHLSHLLIVTNSSINFLIYVVL